MSHAKMNAANRKLLQDLIVRAVAADLTARQREAILWLPIDGSDRVEDKSVRSQSLWGLSTRTVSPGVEARLAGHSIGSLSHKGWTPTAWRLSPFGALVRAEVEAETARAEGVAP